MDSGDQGAAKKRGQTTRRSGEIRSVAQALKALDYLQARGGEARVTEVGTALGVHKSTASRLLATMQEGGYVTKSEETGKYSLGMRLVELAWAKLEQFDLRTYARPFLEELMKKTKETVHLAVMEQGCLVYIDKVDSPHTLVMRSRIGYRIPPFCTALGKAILAELPDQERNALLEEGKLERFTPQTVTDPLLLAENLRQVKRQGYAVDDEEHEIGIRCVGAAIRDHSGTVVGAISISGPAVRIPKPRVKELGVLVKDACLALSQSLGHRG